MNRIYLKSLYQSNAQKNEQKQNRILKNPVYRVIFKFIDNLL